MPSRTEKPDHLIEWALFLLVAVVSLQCGWLLHSANPYEFLRHGGDALGYYQWLPAVFIDHDVDKMYWTYQMENGRSISLFSFGVALLQLPFFLIGHLCAGGFGYPMNGFSSPYGVAQLLGIASYAGAGCVLAYRLACRFSDPVSALLAVLSLFAATNLFYYCVYDPTMSHLYSFFLVGLLGYCTLRLLDGPADPPRPAHAALFLISASLIVLVRQLNAVVLLFPLVMAWRSPGGIRGFLRTLAAHRTLAFSAVLIAAVPWFLQMLYWHHTTGDFFVFTYGKKGENFDFGRMVPGMVMASVRNGWLVYSPLMIPMLGYLLLYAWRGAWAARATLLVLVLVWLLYSAWWCWWLGTGYGHRGFVDIYALLAIPLAWMFRSILQRGWSVRLVSCLVLVALFKLNFGLMERFQWDWSWENWNWQRYFEQVSSVVTG